MTRGWGALMLLLVVGLIQAESAGEVVVGGHIEGLQGSELLLVDNESGQIMEIHPDQKQFSFVFEAGTRYSIEILSPPNGPLQECIINNASGVVDRHDVNDIDITCSVVDEIFGGRFEEGPAPLINQF